MACNVKTKKGIYMLPFHSLHYKLFLAASKALFRQSISEGSKREGQLTVSYSMFSFLYEHFFQQLLQRHFPLFTRSTHKLQMWFSFSALPPFFVFWRVSAVSDRALYCLKSSLFLFLRLQLVTSWGRVTEFTIFPFFARCAPWHCVWALKVISRRCLQEKRRAPWSRSENWSQGNSTLA